MDKILGELNHEQYEAVVSNENYLQISAGPGTGKTATLAARIFYKQFAEGLNPNEMIAISFSRAAKQQLINKMQEYTDLMGYGSVIEIMTFHSLAHRIIRYGIFTEESKYKNGFKVINTKDYTAIKPDITRGLCKEYADRNLVGEALAKCLNLLRQGSHLEEFFLSHWSEIKSERLYKVNIDASIRVNIQGSDIIEFWKRTEKLSKIRNEIDYQGLIAEANKLLLMKKNTYKMITEELKHILVDEYQDTSLSQESLLIALAGKNRDITVVGDKNQTIYTFNGSNVKNMERFLTTFSKIPGKKSKKVHLIQNYRSTENIINLSNHFLEEDIITKANNLPDKIDYSPLIINTQSMELASVYIAKEIERLRKTESISLDNVCVLFRKNSEHSPQLSSLKKEFDLLNIHYDESNKEGEKKLDIKKEILSIYEEYPDYELDELLQLVEEKDFSQEAVIFIKEAMESGAAQSEDLVDFIVDMDEKIIQDGTAKVRLKTVHSSKGQEYPVVFILYLGDRQFPHGSNPDIEEEKRLLYVALTRAKDRLYILGKHGVLFEDFLGKCREAAGSKYIYFNNRFEHEELEGYGLQEDDKEIIRETTRKQEYQDSQSKARLAKYMEEW
jgi:DNA helicase II / ATP-dependent DNA helicase PcrA